MYVLSQRLKLIASLVPVGARVCDIGTDHGYLSIYLKSNNIAESVIATDIRKKPLENAKSNILKSGVQGIETRLCDGLSAVNKDEADTVIIAGMGGEVIAGILGNCEWLKGNTNITLILQPMTSPEALRKYLISKGYHIQSEPALCENEKIYSVIVAKYCGIISKQNESYYYIGEVSPSTDDGLSYIKKQLKRCLDCVEALEGVASKHNEYLLYKEAADGIMAKIDSVTESI